MQAQTLEGQLLVPGGTYRGRVAVRPHPNAHGYVFVTPRLTARQYPIIRKCGGIVCEAGGVADHPAVICRILGKPVIQLEQATALLRPGELITLEGDSGRIVRGRADPIEHSLAAPRRELAALMQREGIRFQVSIVDERDIARVNHHAGAALPVAQFFLREELLWVKHGLDPLGYLQEHGITGTATFLRHQLQRCLSTLQPDQMLNYRGLDWRAEYEEADGVPAQRQEGSSSELGLHGVRMLLREAGMLTAELLAVDALARRGHHNIMFSLPFITVERELDEVRLAIRAHCTHAIRLGIFIETAAAVLELPYLLSKGVDHVYIGTKDLTQMILACDRRDPRVRELYDSKQRPVMTTIQTILRTCDAVHVPVVLFSLLEDMPFFLQHLVGLQSLSISCGEYELLHAASMIN